MASLAEGGATARNTHLIGTPVSAAKSRENMPHAFFIEMTSLQAKGIRLLAETVDLIGPLKLEVDFCGL